MRSRSILDIEGGNIIRQIDNELERVIYNINDESTDLKAREIKISIKITPNKKRNELGKKIQQHKLLKIMPSLQLFSSLEYLSQFNYLSDVDINAALIADTNIF